MRFERPGVVVNVATVSDGAKSGRLSRSLMHECAPLAAEPLGNREQISAFVQVLVRTAERKTTCLPVSLRMSSCDSDQANVVAEVVLPGATPCDSGTAE